MSEFLVEVLKAEDLTEVVDIGANPIDGDPPYRPMLTAGLCRVTGFEPQPDALAALRRQQGPNERYLPYVVGDGKEHTLRVCRASGMTSLFEPDRAALALFDPMTTFGEVVERIPLQTHRFDDITEVDHLDLLKIDIQGGELAVFKNGREKLRGAVVIQTEVSFITLYENQPGMGEVDVELRSQGFVPHCFVPPVKLWPVSPLVVNNHPRWALNQLLEADIVYIRDITKPEQMSGEQLKQLCLIAHYCYKSFDVVVRCLMLLEQRDEVPAGTQQQYVSWVGSPTVLGTTWPAMQVTLGLSQTT